MNPLFHLGPLYITPPAIELLEQVGQDFLPYLGRHVTGDWGDLCEEDKQSNQSALKTGARIMSSYNLPNGEKIWIITDAEIDDDHHRYATTILRPDDY